MLAKSAQSVKALIEAGANVNHVDEFGNTVLEYATSPEIVDLVMQTPGFDLKDIKLTDYNQKINIIMALDKNHLLSIDDDDLDSYLRLFETALQENSLEGVQYIHNKLTNAISKDQNTPYENDNKLWDGSGYKSEVQRIIDINSTKNSIQILEFLISKGFTVSPCWITDPATLVKLSKSGADLWCNGASLRIADTESLNELFSLVDDNTKEILAKRLLNDPYNVEVMQFLLNQKEKLKCLDQTTLNNLLNKTDNPEVASLLIKNGAIFEETVSISSIKNSIALKNYIDHGGDINAKLPNDNTLLTEAVEHSDLQMVKMLLDAGADVKAADQSACCGGLIHIAFTNDADDEIVQLLVKAGADINRKYDGEHTLDLAIKHDDIRLLKYLIEAGLDAKPENISCEYLNSIGMLEYLLSIGLKADGVMEHLCGPEGDCPGRYFDDHEMDEIREILNASQQTPETKTAETTKHEVNDDNHALRKEINHLLFCDISAKRSQSVIICSSILEHFVLEQAWACGAQGDGRDARSARLYRPPCTPQAL